MSLPADISKDFEKAMIPEPPTDQEDTRPVQLDPLDPLPNPWQWFWFQVDQNVQDAYQITKRGIDMLVHLSELESFRQ